MVALHFVHPVSWVRLMSEADRSELLAGRLGHAEAAGECDTYTISDIVDAPGRERHRLAREVAIVTYAGMVAERDLAGVEVDPMETYEDVHVDAIMQRVPIGPRGGFVGDDAWQRYKGGLANEATALVRRYRGAIEAMSRALVERGELNGPEMRAIARL